MKLFYILLLNMVFLCGCSKQVPHIDKSPVDQTKPEMLLKKYYYAVVDNNEKRFLECFSQSKHSQEFGKLVFLHYKLLYEFKDRLTLAYGENAWIEYQKAQDNKSNYVMMELPKKNEVDNWLGNYVKSSVKLNGNEVVKFVQPGLPPIAPVIACYEKGGIWYMYYSLEANSKKEIKLIKLINKAIQDTIPYIGKDGVEISDIKDMLTDKISKHIPLAVPL